MASAYSMRDISARFCIGRAGCILDEVTGKADALQAPVLLQAASEWRKLAELLFAQTTPNPHQFPGEKEKKS